MVYSCIILVEGTDLSAKGYDRDKKACNSITSARAPLIFCACRLLSGQAGTQLRFPLSGTPSIRTLETSISRVQIERGSYNNGARKFFYTNYCEEKTKAKREMGRTSPALLVIFAALAVLLAALPPFGQSSSRHHHHHHGYHYHVQSRGHGEGGWEQVAAKGGKEARAWPCCDNCGGCTRSIPPQCQCLDAARGGCHPACRDCVRSGLSVDPPVFQCMDRIPNFCLRRCTAVAAH